MEPNRDVQTWNPLLSSPCPFLTDRDEDNLASCRWAEEFGRLATSISLAIRFMSTLDQWSGGYQKMVTVVVE
jgi:hypothetical protein